jgi:hypothetical protein
VAIGGAASTAANAASKTYAQMHEADFVTLLGDKYQAGADYPTLIWQAASVTPGDVGDIEDNSTVNIGSENNTNRVALSSDLVDALATAQNVRLDILTSNGSFLFDAAAVDEIMAAAGGEGVIFNAVKVGASEDETIQDLINSGALVYDFSLTTASGAALFTETGSGKVTVTIPYALGYKDATKIKVYNVANGVKTEIDADYDPVTQTISFEVSHFSTYAIEYQGLNIWASIEGTNHYNTGEQVTVKIYADTDTAYTYGSYQADINFANNQLTYNAAASTKADGTSYMNLVEAGKVRIGYASESSTTKTIGTDDTLLATLVFDLKAIALPTVSGNISVANASFGDPGSSSDLSATPRAAADYYLHNITLTFKAGTGTVMDIVTAYVKYGAVGIYTTNAYTNVLTVPSPSAASGYRLGDPLWKNNAGTGVNSAAIAAASYTDSDIFTAQSVKTWNVTFYDNTGTIIGATQTVDAGAKATAPADPTLDYHDFAGWYVVTSASDAYVAQSLLSKATIDDTAVTANIMYKAHFTLSQYDFTKPDSITVTSGVTGNKVSYGTAITFTMNAAMAPDGYNNTVTYAVGGVDKGVLTADGTGTYTIPGSAVTGAIEIFVTQAVKGTIEFIEHDDYVIAKSAGNVDYKIVVLTSGYTNMDRASMRYTFDGNTELFYSAQYGAYIAFVPTTETITSALQKLALDTTAATVTVNYDGNVNAQNGVTTLDAQIIYDLLNNIDVAGITDLGRFVADDNSDKTVTTNDAYRIIVRIFNIV